MSKASFLTTSLYKGKLENDISSFLSRRLRESYNCKRMNLVSILKLPSFIAGKFDRAFL